MAIVLTKRAQAARVKRTYNCGDCGLQWIVLHEHMDEPVPDCPTCAVRAEWQVPLPGLLTTKSQAIDIAQKMAEQDFGLTNFHDNSRPGDVAYMAPSPMQTAERDQITQQLMEQARAVQNAGGEIAPEVKAVMGAGDFWTQGSSATPNMGNAVPGVASPAVQQQRAEGTGGIDILEKARGEGMLRPMNTVMGRASMEPAA